MNDSEMNVPLRARDHARRVLTEEANALQSLADRQGEAIDRATELLLGCQNRVVVTGMGKSGDVGRKIAGTLASTGTPSQFLHPGEALHGNLGMVMKNDVVLALSYSGETDELLAILPALSDKAAHLVAITGAPLSSLGRVADVVLDVAIGVEACPMNLAPTTSTTAMIAVGDALAVAVMEARGFGPRDYARLHPAGSLGRRLLLRVSHLMRTGDQLAVVPSTAPVHAALLTVTKAGAGVACVVDEGEKLVGVFSDGDARRFFVEYGPQAWDKPVGEAMTRDPRTVSGDPLASDTLDRFEHESVKIGDMPVLDADGKPVGLLTLKDLVRAGIATPGSRAAHE